MVGDIVHRSRPLMQIVVLEPAQQVLANGNRVSVMKQVLREDVRQHLPRLRHCDDCLVDAMDRFCDDDIKIEWSKAPSGRGDGKGGMWWKEQPVFRCVARPFIPVHLPL